MAQQAVNEETYIDVLEQKARQIGFGELKVKLIIYDGVIMGIDQEDPATIKFRSKNIPAHKKKR